MNSFQARRIQYIQSLFENNPKLFETVKYPEVLKIKREGTKRVVAILPLKDHQLYEETVLYIFERFNEGGEITHYHYAWEYSQRLKILGKQPRHIMAFGNEDHRPGTPAWVPSNPYHHHHVPGEPRKRKSTSVQDLETTIDILTDYIYGQLPYSSSTDF